MSSKSVLFAALSLFLVGACASNSTLNSNQTIDYDEDLRIKFESEVLNDDSMKVCLDFKNNSLYRIYISNADINNGHAFKLSLYDDNAQPIYKFKSTNRISRSPPPRLNDRTDFLVLSPNVGVYSCTYIFDISKVQASQLELRFNGMILFGDYEVLDLETDGHSYISNFKKDRDFKFLLNIP